MSDMIDQRNDPFQDFYGSTSARLPAEIGFAASGVMLLDQACLFFNKHQPSDKPRKRR